MKISTVNCGTISVDAGMMFGNLPENEWQNRYPVQANGTVKLALRSMLIEYDDRVILINNGCGLKLSEEMKASLYLENEFALEQSLRDLKLAFSTVTDVILTHLHFDHCGGSTVINKGRVEPAFPHARYWVSRSQFESFLHPEDNELESFIMDDILPVYEQSKLCFIEDEPNGFCDISFRRFNGHSTGMLVPIVRYGKENIAFVSDLIPFAPSLILDCVSRYDNNPVLTIQEKTLFLAEAVQQNYILWFEHDTEVACCRLKLEHGLYLKHNSGSLMQWIET